VRALARLPGLVAVAVLVAAACLPASAAGAGAGAGEAPTVRAVAFAGSTGTAGDGTITTSYDRLNRPTGVDYSDATPDVTRSYDLAGRPDQITDAAGTITYSFDDADRLTDITRTGGGSGLNGTLHYDYDNAAVRPPVI
jgi:YD repeat-containing protein